ncbi:MAG: hypothetical protein E7582_05435 [Ruminococcaceae bacterium]|nr:hypothetical protein [Oscillospiraceae bacterium]
MLKGNIITMEINLNRLFSLLLVKLKYIILVAVIAAIAAFSYTNAFMTEKYTSSAKFLVLMETSQNKSSELTFAQESISSYMAIFRARDFFNEVVDTYNEENPDEELTTSQLMSITDIQSSTNSDEATFTIKVTTTDPEKSYKFTKLISEHAKAKVAGIETLNEIMMVESPVKSFVPSSPNIKSNTFLGFVIGFVLTAAAFVLKELLDGRIKNAEDVKALCNISILGVIPDNESERSGKSSKKVISNDYSKEEL